MTAPDILRPIIGIETRTAQEAFDIMCDRFRGQLLHVAGNGNTLTVADVDAVIDRLAANPVEAHQDAIRFIRFLSFLAIGAEQEKLS